MIKRDTQKDERDAQKKAGRDTQKGREKLKRSLKSLRSSESENTISCICSLTNVLLNLGREKAIKFIEMRKCNLPIDRAIVLANDKYEPIRRVK